MTQPFDIEAMRKDMDTGTPGPWTATIHHAMGYDRLVEIDYVEGPKGTGVHISPRYAVESEVGPNARRIARVPAMEAEILRLTSENERLREALSLIAVMGYSESPEVSKRIAELAVNQARKAVRESHAVDARAALGDAP